MRLGLPPFPNSFVLVPSSFRGDAFPVIADAIFEALKPYRDGLRGLVLYIKRG